MISKTQYRLQGMEVELHAFLISVLREGMYSQSAALMNCFITECHQYQFGRKPGWSEEMACMSEEKEMEEEEGKKRKNKETRKKKEKGSRSSRRRWRKGRRGRMRRRGIKRRGRSRRRWRRGRRGRKRRRGGVGETNYLATPSPTPT